MTSNFEPAETQGPFVPPNIIIPDDWKEAQLALTNYLIKVAEAVNARDIGQYQDANVSGGVNISDTVTGQAWYTTGDANKFRYGSRTVVKMGTLANAGATTVAHGIAVTSNTVFTHIWGVANNPGTLSYPLPNPGIDSVSVEVNATNVIVTSTTDLTAFTDCFVVLEWVDSV